MVTDLPSAIKSVQERVGPAVVGLRRGWGGGSGTVVAPGQVLTNAHNLRHDEVSVSFTDGAVRAGRVAAVDPDLDLAVIRVDTDDIEPISWPRNGGPEIGTAVLALADPGGRGLHVSPGFVSSVSAGFRGPRGRPVRGAIEHTAPLPRGSSGGPLVDLEGRLLGLNTARLDPGLVLAVPLSGRTAERVDALARGEQPRAVRLGVAVAPPRVARRLRAAVGLPEREGILVRAVQDGSPADRAGVTRGDLIVAVDGRTPDSLDSLYGALDEAQSAGHLELTVLRGSEERAVAVSLTKA